jgi:hypothetical protein
MKRASCGYGHSQICPLSMEERPCTFLQSAFDGIKLHSETCCNTMSVEI